MDTNTPENLPKGCKTLWLVSLLLLRGFPFSFAFLYAQDTLPPVKIPSTPAIRITNTSIQLPESHSRDLPTFLSESDPVRLFHHISGVQNAEPSPRGLTFRGRPWYLLTSYIDEAPLLTPFHMMGMFGVLPGSASRTLTLHRNAPPPHLENHTGSILFIESRTPAFRFSPELLISSLALSASASIPLHREGSWRVLTAFRETYLNWILKAVGSLRRYGFRDMLFKIAHHSPRNPSRQFGSTFFLTRDIFRLFSQISPAYYDLLWDGALMVVRYTSEKSWKIHGFYSRARAQTLQHPGSPPRPWLDQTLQYGGIRFLHPFPSHPFSAGVSAGILHLLTNQSLLRVPETPDNNSDFSLLPFIQPWIQFLDSLSFQKKVRIQTSFRPVLWLTSSRKFRALPAGDLQISYSPGKFWSVNFSASYYVRLYQLTEIGNQLPLLQQYFLLGDTPLRGMLFSGGIQYTHSRMYFRMGPYFSQTTGVRCVPFFPDVLHCILRTWGWETELHYWTRKWIFWVSLTWSRAFFSHPAIQEGRAFPAPSDIPLVVGTFVQWRVHSTIRISVLFLYGSGRPYTLPTGWIRVGNSLVPLYTSVRNFRLPPYHRMDLSVVWDPRRPLFRKIDWSVLFSVYNVYNRRNVLTIQWIPRTDPQTGARIFQPYAETLFPIIPSIAVRFHRI